MWPDINGLAVDLAIQLAIKNCDGTVEDAVEKFFDLLYPVLQAIQKKKMASSNKALSKDKDPRFIEAVKIAKEQGSVSVSILQRRMRIGFARAEKLMEDMTEMGIVSKQQGAEPRLLLMQTEEIKRLLMNLDADIFNQGAAD